MDEMFVFMTIGMIRILTRENIFTTKIKQSEQFYLKKKTYFLQIKSPRKESGYLPILILSLWGEIIIIIIDNKQ